MPLTLPELTLGDIEADIAALETDVATLETNIRTSSVANMSNDNYTMTEAESNSALIAPINVGTSKTLTFPTSTNSTRPALILIYGAFTTGAYTIKAQGSATTITANAGQSYLISATDSSGIIDFTSILATSSRRASNGVATSIAAPTATLADGDGGKLLVADSGSAQVLDINSGLLTENLVFDVMCTGAGGLTIQAGTGGVTVIGDAVLAANESKRVFRSGSTETYYIA